MTEVPDGTEPRIVADTRDLAARVGEPGEIGAVWNIPSGERDLDANVIALPPGEGIALHRGPAIDVLIYVVAGAGTLTTATTDIALSPGHVVWLPRGSRRAFTAGPGGLRYLTVHQHRTPGPLLGA